MIVISDPLGIVVPVPPAEGVQVQSGQRGITLVFADADGVGADALDGAGVDEVVGAVNGHVTHLERAVKFTTRRRPPDPDALAGHDFGVERGGL